MAYYILYITEDSHGGRLDGPFSKEVILERIEEEYYGELKWLSEEEMMKIDWDMCCRVACIINGEIIVPKPIRVVEKFDL